ncbi:MAG: PhoH family protein [Candidatus Pacebacteria bacterium]|nr:PhoH family protein [Candidatus Paceibacterota bacterium]
MQKNKKEKKIFVYDTSFFLQDHLAILKHGDHLNIIPYTVITEMGNFKKGDDEINVEARSFQRWLNDEIFPNGALHDTWYSIMKGYKGRIMIAEFNSRVNVPIEIDPTLNDDRILWSAIDAKRQFPDARVVLLTYDINLQLKAKFMGVNTTNGNKEIINVKTTLQKNSFIEKKESISDKVVQQMNEHKQVASGEITPNKKPLPNTFFILGKTNRKIEAIYHHESDTFRKISEHTPSNIKSRSIEQKMAIHVLLDPEIKLVVLLGASGTGKTLLPLACALEQKRLYEQIFLSRPIIPLNNKDIGYLPGDIKSKLNPYMEPLWDNLKLIKSTLANQKNGASELKKIDHMVDNEKLLIQPLAYIRGRSISNVFFIVDEAQNLTSLEAKTIITRAGENTKIVFTGDIHQIDTPYLSIENNGLSYITKNIVSEPNTFSSVVILEQGERSILATWGSKMK